MQIDSVSSGMVMSPSECQRLIQQAGRHSLSEGEIFGNRGASKLQQIRSVTGTEIADESIKQFVFSLFKKMNPLQLEISGLEPIQIFKYDVGDHYMWHTDWSPHNNKKRKLSITIQLSDPSEYEGGEVEILDGPQSRTVTKDLGHATVFPSWAVHKVTPVTSGTRWALVAWATGKPFK
jgi:predicted 2-oxoglutarate/Fe(II)-dependent dioxygenase YbiX